MNSRRSFLCGLGAAGLAVQVRPTTVSPFAAASMAALPAAPPPDAGHYVVGVVGNPQLPGSAGALLLRPWLSVDADGTGFGTLADRHAAGFRCHLAVHSTVRQPGSVRFDGVVVRAEEPQLIGQPFVLTADLAGPGAVLELTLLGQSFTGHGMVTA